MLRAQWPTAFLCFRQMLETVKARCLRLSWRYLFRALHAHSLDATALGLELWVPLANAAGHDHSMKACLLLGSGTSDSDAHDSGAHDSDAQMQGLQGMRRSAGVGPHLVRAALREHSALLDRPLAAQDWDLTDALFEQVSSRGPLHAMMK